MDITILARESLNRFAWDTFKSFQPAGYALVLLFFVFGLLLYFFTRGEGEELSVILTRTVAAILLITFFKDLIEAAKEITWTLEQVISASSFEDAQVSLMTSIHPNTQAKVMSSFFIQLPLMMIAKVIFFILNLIFSYVWVFLVASAPVIIPMMICHFFDYFANNFGYATINDLISSLFNTTLMPLTLPLSSFAGLLSFYFGLNVQTVVAFIILLIMELFSLAVEHSLPI
jgi:hypothetical protein